MPLEVSPPVLSPLLPPQPAIASAPATANSINAWVDLIT